MTGTARDLREVLRDEIRMRPRIIALLQAGPKTIPEIAGGLGFPTPEVTLWIMAMRRYGLVHDLPKERADDYYQYELAKQG